MTAPQLFAQIQGQGTVSADNLNTYTQWCVNITQLRAFIGLTGMMVFVEGSSSPGDGGQGLFYWNATSIGPDNGTTIIVPQPGVAGAWVMLIGGFNIGPGVVGSSRNVVMSVSAASATATLTADEIIVESILGGLAYKIGSFSETINLATVGANGMDTGTAPTSGYVALYAIYNPSSGATALLGVNATSSVAPSIYGGVNAPAGYTASALVSVWTTNSSKQFITGYQTGRMISRNAVTVLSTTTPQASITALSISSAVPMNANSINGFLNVANNTSGDSAQLNMYPTIVNFGAISSFVAISAGASINIPFSLLQISTPQELFYSSSVSAGTGTFAIAISSYSF